MHAVKQPVSHFRGIGVDRIEAFLEGNKEQTVLFCQTLYRRPAQVRFRPEILPTARVGFIGDSITQGIGTPPNSYLGWNAQLTAVLPENIACWNLGLGYGRAADMASGGAWLYKALQNDVIFVCYGVNDLYQYGDADRLICHLDTIVRYLTEANKTVILQTIPPFDYPAHLVPLWERVNTHIRTVLADRVTGVFDVVPVLGCENAPHMAKYGGHPDAEGCRAWASALYAWLNTLPHKIF